MKKDEEKVGVLYTFFASVFNTKSSCSLGAQVGFSPTLNFLFPCGCFGVFFSGFAMSFQFFKYVSLNCDSLPNAKSWSGASQTVVVEQAR